MTVHNPGNTKQQIAAMKNLTFGKAMQGEIIMLVIALAVIYLKGSSIGYWGHLGIVEAIVYGVLGGIVAYLVMYLTYLIPGDFMDDLKQQLSSIKVALDKMADWQLICLAIAAGVAEEFLFREVLQRWLVTEMGIISGIVLASLAFGLAHAISIPYIIITFIIGVILGILFEYSGSLVLVMLIHAVYDAIAFMVIRYRPEWLKLTVINP
jgi:membrane protease YdiL (CAAX protease family)